MVNQKHLRRTVRPNGEHERRTDNSLKIWIKEAKNVPCKKRYFCEICLDQEQCARTSSKTKSDMLFWGEHFEFNNLAPLQTITVNLYREADRKKKKDKNCKIGYLNIPVLEIHGRQYVEKWFTASSGTVGKSGKENKSDLPLIRIRARYQTVNILPVDQYQEFTQYLTTEYCTLCEVMEQLVGVRDKEEIATTLVHIMQRLNKAKDFLTDVIVKEVKRQENQSLTFRGNSIATKAMEAYMKLIGEKYLQDTLVDFIKQIIQTEDDCEVDPTKLNNPGSLNNHQRLLDMYCEMVWAKIINSHHQFPSELRQVFASFRHHCEAEAAPGVADNLICGSIFLRFLCPAILSPSLFNLIQEFPPDRAARNLTLIAKTIQTLANSTKFGGKEEFMIFMNEFIERHSDNMKQFLSQISSMEGVNQFLEYDGYIDLGKEVSILHTFLVESLEKASEEMVTKLGKLPSILSNITDATNDPDIGKSVPNKRKSQIYDNLVNMPPPGSSSSTAIIRDMLRQSEDDIPVLGSRHATQGSLDSRQMAEDLNYNDEYVRIVNTRLETEVSNVSVSSRSVSNELNVNQSWNDIVNAAEGNHGDYIDLISFIDDDPQNTSMELEHNINGSQMSISQISTIASSGYQSYGYSQSNSPVDSTAQNDISRDFSKSPNVQSMQPLSFSNPMYRHKLTMTSNSSPNTTISSVNQGSLNFGSLSCEDESSSIKNRSPVRSDKDLYQQNDPLRNLAPKLSSSSSSESLDQDKLRYSQNKETNKNDNDPVKFDLHSSCPSRVFEDMHNSNFVGNQTGQGYSLSRAPSRPVELSHAGSVDFSYLRQKFGDGMRRTATDSRIAQMGSPVQIQSDSGVSVSSSKSQISPEDSPAHRRLSPQNAVHMGIRSVQRKIQEQEKTKQEYEQEVSVLRQQLLDAQKRLNSAEQKLQDHEAGTQQLIDDWQVRLEESEERMRRQQAEKDDQMKHIIQRLMSVEDELRHDQEDMQNLVHQKQKVIEAQEKRIQTLDNANAKLMTALNQLRNVSQTHNGMLGPLRSTLISSEMAEFKTSSC